MKKTLQKERRGRNKVSDEDDEKEQNIFVFVCVALCLANSKPKEKWVQCLDWQAGLMKHDIGGELLYVCLKC